MINESKIKEIYIDHKRDGIEFKLSLIDRNKIDKWNYYKLIVAIGVHLEIFNYLEELEVLELGLCIVTSDQGTHLYRSKDLDAILPLSINIQHKISLYFEGHNFESILKNYQDEKAFFYLKTLIKGEIKTYETMEFHGDSIEKDLDKIKQGDLANWSQKNFIKLDKGPTALNA